MPRTADSIARDIHDALGVPLEDAQLYIETVRSGRLVPDESTRGRAAALSARGMLILDSKGRSYLPVHPRMALSNLFRAYDEKAARQRKEKRLLVDKLTLELIPMLAGESKGTNGGTSRGGRAA